MISCFLGAQAKELTQNLEKIVKNDKLEKFIESLQRLHHPELRLNDSMKSLNKHVKSISPKLNPKDALPLNVINKFIACKDKLLLNKLDGLIGSYNKQFNKRFEAFITKCMGNNCNKLISRESWDKLYSECQDFIESEESKNMFRGGKVLLILLDCV